MFWNINPIIMDLKDQYQKIIFQAHSEFKKSHSCQDLMDQTVLFDFNNSNQDNHVVIIDKYECMSSDPELLNERVIEYLVSKLE